MKDNMWFQHNDVQPFAKYKGCYLHSQI